MKTKSLFLTNKGFTIVEMIFSLIILIFSLLTISSVSKMITDFSARINSKQKLTNIKSDMINNVSQSKVWINLVNNADKAHPSQPGVKMNSDLLCLKNRTSCNVGTYDLTLMDMNGNLLTDPNTATKGFDSNGVACNSYGVDPNCAFRFSLNWTAICPAGSGSCLNPQIKVKITATSSNQTYANTKTLSPFELLVSVDKDSDPVIKKAVIITNSTHYTPSDAPVKFDPSPYIFSENKINFTIDLADSPNSVNGGTLSTASNIIVYTPSNSFYGFDQFQYKVTNPINGKSYLATAWVWVMTPHTWTGLGSNQDTSNNANFCGKVKNGACDGVTFPANDKHYIFNSSCTNCNANLNSNPMTLEMSKDFTGSVKQTMNVSFVGMGGASWQRLPVFLQKGGNFDGQTGNVLSIQMSAKSGYVYDTVNDWSFVLAGGSFKSPSVLRVSGPVDIQPTANFVHNNGLVNLFQVYQTNLLVQAPGVNFYDLQFDNLNVAFNSFSSHYQFIVNKNFTVNNDIIFSVRGIDSTVSGNSSTTISVKGNVIIRGAGGTGSDSPYLSIDGTGIQTITGVSAPGVMPNPNTGNVNNLIPFLPKVRINKTLGKVVINDWVGYKGFEVLSVPDQGIDVTNTTFLFSMGGGDIPFMPGNLHLKDVFFIPGGSSYANVRFLSPNVYIDGNMYHYTNGYSHIFFDPLVVPNSKIHLLGDLYIDGGFDHDKIGNAVTVYMIGANNSKIFGTNTSIAQVHIDINKQTGSKVDLKGGFGTSRDLKLSNGILNVDPGLLVRIPNHGWNGFTSTFTTPNVQFHNMSIDHGFRANSDILLDGDLNIGTNGGGGYSLSLGGAGQFVLEGNLNLGSGLPYGGGQKILFTGVNDSAINFTAFAGTQKNLGTTEFLINKETPATKVTYNPGSVRIANLSVARGTLDMISSSAIQTNTASSAAATSIINKNCNTITATTTNFNGVVNPGACGAM